MRVLLVENDASLAVPWADALSRAGYDVDIAGTVADAWAILSAMSYAAVVLDLELPDGDGMDALRRLRAAGTTTPVLVLSGGAGVLERVRVLEAGADDVMQKPLAFEELLHRLRALLRRPGPTLGGALALGNLLFDTGSGQLVIDGRPEPLTMSLARTLEILLERPGRIVSNDDILHRLSVLGNSIDADTVKVYVYRLRNKLMLAGAAVQIGTIPGTGYFLSDLETRHKQWRRRHSS